MKGEKMKPEKPINCTCQYPDVILRNCSGHDSSCPCHKKLFENIQKKPENKRQEFIELAKPLIKWMNDNMHLRAKIVIDCTSAELVSGEIGFTTDEYVRD